MQLFIVISALASVSLAQQQYTTPIPILKQINRQNEDGSYSYGYEAADGSFKIETKYPTGEVHGKYGYIDDQGQKREIEYGASKNRGFEPHGTDINVPPPTINNDKNAVIAPLGPGEEDDGQYREDPTIYWKDPKYNNGIKYTSAPVSAPVAPVSTPRQEYYQQPQSTYYQPPPQNRFNYAQPAHYQQPQYSPSSRVDVPAHPAITSYDINTGSYTISFTG